MTNVPDCYDLLELNFMVNNSCVTIGSALVMLRLRIVHLILFKFVELFIVPLLDDLDVEANSLAVSTLRT